jgi:two-component system LytT family response regulator
MIRTIIVDDEPLARDGIKLRLKNDESIRVIGEYGNGLDAVKNINSLLPDLVFLDIQMPGIDGFEVIKNLNTNPLPFIIFITAYDKYALKAFEVHAVDYLLKPINDARFSESLKRVKEQILNNNIISFEQKIKSLISVYPQPGSTIIKAAGNSTEEITDKIAVKSKNGFYLLNIEEIEWIEAAGDYVYLHSAGKKHLHRATMQAMEIVLSSPKFQRIHRSVIVNLDKIKEIQPTDHGDFFIFLCNGAKLKLSRNYKDKLLSLLKINC